jgi:hypothetical protein
MDIANDHENQALWHFGIWGTSYSPHVKQKSINLNWK